MIYLYKYDVRLSTLLGDMSVIGEYRSVNPLSGLECAVHQMINDMRAAAVELRAQSVIKTISARDMKMSVVFDVVDDLTGEPEATIDHYATAPLYANQRASNALIEHLVPALTAVRDHIREQLIGNAYKKVAA
jgi:hypothetical protein